MRPSDVPTYVEAGAADLGITGKDVLLEQRDRAVYELLDLGYGACRMVLAGRRGDESLGESERRLGAMRIATKYPRIAERYFEQHRPPGRGDRGQGLGRARAAGRASPTGSSTSSTPAAPWPRTTSRSARRSPPAPRAWSPTASPTSCARPRSTRSSSGCGRPRAMRIERIEWDGADAAALAARLRGERARARGRIRRTSPAIIARVRDRRRRGAARARRRARRARRPTSSARRSRGGRRGARACSSPTCARRCGSPPRTSSASRAPSSSRARAPDARRARPGPAGRGARHEPVAAAGRLRARAGGPPIRRRC